jgi:uncharacterized protein (DUF1778 family)
MSNSQSRAADQVITLRCTADQRELLRRAIEIWFKDAPGFAATSMSRFVLNAALEKASAIVSAAGGEIPLGVARSPDMARLLTLPGEKKHSRPARARKT